MFGSDDFPLGPNGQYPKQRIATAGNELISPQDIEETYLCSGLAKLPVRERDFHSSLNKVKGRMKIGRMMREDQDEQQFCPRSKKMMQTSKWERRGY